ncbi:hypothetical protein T02_13399 [Trichinella nativa]|uniref:Uncharacterized protein n=1 Tax=Trichinella nativa TaxID=6335 RepID=A0A0V1L7T9_9BILA|nr:hypothetical protein T02_13399 [Trichinella nativa]
MQKLQPITPGNVSDSNNICACVPQRHAFVVLNLFLYYKNEPQAQMLLESEKFPGILESSTASKRLPCAYLNTQGSSPSETPLILIDDIFRHYNEVFAENAETCAIFRCFGQLPCAYLNTQGSSPSETPLILIDDS